MAMVVASGFLTGSALAVDLDNNDSRTYQVKIRSGASTTNSSIGSKVIQKGVCSNCEIEVVGVGAAKVSGKMTVVINGGRLSIRK
jgi:hypothetical protein